MGRNPACNQKVEGVRGKERNETGKNDRIKSTRRGGKPRDRELRHPGRRGYLKKKKKGRPTEPGERPGFRGAVWGFAIMSKKRRTDGEKGEKNNEKGRGRKRGKEKRPKGGTNDHPFLRPNTTARKDCCAAQFSAGNPGKKKGWNWNKISQNDLGGGGRVHSKDGKNHFQSTGWKKRTPKGGASKGAHAEGRKRGRRISKGST